uniref:Putative secreted protein n=1 Tax=Anopheles darlingi TaxID=43151 RepID=A0A2M4DIG1_ANODA
MDFLVFFVTFAFLTTFLGASAGAISTVAAGASCACSVGSTRCSSTGSSFSASNGASSTGAVSSTGWSS